MKDKATYLLVDHANVRPNTAQISVNTIEKIEMLRARCTYMCRFSCSGTGNGMDPGWGALKGAG